MSRGIILCDKRLRQLDESSIKTLDSGATDTHCAEFQVGFENWVELDNWMSMWQSMLTQM